MIPQLLFLLVVVAAIFLSTVIAGPTSNDRAVYPYSKPNFKFNPSPLWNRQLKPSKPSVALFKQQWNFASDGDLQIRTAFIPTGGGSVVGWTTNGTVASGYVLWGLSPSSLNQKSSAIQTTYGTEAVFHYAELSPMKSNTKYYYQIVNNDPSSTSQVYPLVSAKSAKDDGGDFNVLVVGDLGIPNPENQGATNTMELMYMWQSKYDWVLHIGDLSYADDWNWPLEGFSTYEHIWNAWQAMMTPICAVKQYQSLPGNHEVTCDEGNPWNCSSVNQNFTAYQHRFNMNGNLTGGMLNMWYSFQYGLVYFIQLDSETDYPNSKSGPGTFLNANNFAPNISEQTDWFQSELIKANSVRDKYPWIIVSTHRPIFSTAPDDQCQGCSDAFQPLANKYKVDLWFAGHSHLYERFYPSGLNGSMPDGQSYKNPTVPVYILNGAGGSIEGITGSKYIQTPPPNSAVVLLDFGLGLLSVSKNQLEWNYYAANNATLLDTVTIVKDDKFRKRHFVKP